MNKTESEYRVGLSARSDVRHAVAIAYDLKAGSQSGDSFQHNGFGCSRLCSGTGQKACSS